MLAKSLDELYFSQSALVAYQNCPLKFRRRYLDGLFWPADWGGNEEQKKAVEQGRLFHLLAQRYYSRGEVPNQELLSNELAIWFERLQKFRPYYENGNFYPEHEIRINASQIKLVAKYDLLYVTVDGRAVIYDWKTTVSKKQDGQERQISRRSNSYWLHHFQTIVYRYVLCKAGGVYSPKGVFKPEEISMIYWNPEDPHWVEPIGYSQSQFVKDENLILKTIGEIKNLDYDAFLATGDQKQCERCEYRPICHGKRAVHVELEEEDTDFDLSWEAIDEIQI